MIKLKSLLFENIQLQEFISFFGNDIKMIKTFSKQILKEFKGGLSHQKWTLIRKNDVIRLWGEFGRYGIINENGILTDMIDLTIENIYKILVNTLLIYKYDNNNKLHKFMSDETGTYRYTDGYHSFKNLLQKLKFIQTSTDKEKLMILDEVFNTLHSDEEENMAGWFVEGGMKTLDKIRDMNPNWENLSESVKPTKNPIQSWKNTWLDIKKDLKRKRKTPLRSPNEPINFNDYTHKDTNYDIYGLHSDTENPYDPKHKKMMQMKYIQIINQYKKLNGKSCWRIIFLNKKMGNNPGNIKKLGYSWSITRWPNNEVLEWTGEGMGYGTSGVDGYTVIYEGIIDIKTINWLRTLRKRLEITGMSDVETEINFKNGSKIFIKNAIVFTDQNNPEKFLIKPINDFRLI